MCEMTIHSKDVPLVLLQFQQGLPAEIKPAAFDALVGFVATLEPVEDTHDAVLVSMPDLTITEVAIQSQPILAPAAHPVLPEAVVPDLPNLPEEAAPAAPAEAPSAKGKPWTLEELQQARELANAGKSSAEIGRALGRPSSATYMAIKRYGVRGTEPLKAPGPKQLFVSPKAAKSVSADMADKPIKNRRSEKAGKPDQKPARDQETVKKAAAVPASKTNPEPKASPALAKRTGSALHDAVADKLPPRQIAMVSHLITLPATFSKADDLYLAEGVTQRRPTPEMVDQIGCEAPALIARWKSMAPPSLRDRSGHLMAEFREDLLSVLRWLVEWETRPHV